MLEHRLVKDAAFPESHLAKAVGDPLGLELLHAGERDGSDRRALLQRNHHHRLGRVDAHVAEKTRGVEAANGLGCELLGEALADFDGQLVKHRSRFSSLDAVDSDVRNDKRIERMGEKRQQQKRQDQDAQDSVQAATASIHEQIPAYGHPEQSLIHRCFHYCARF